MQSELMNFSSQKRLLFLLPHIELLAALLSGALILTAWYVSQQNETVSIVLYLLAFVIGGFAKAKEGIKATIEDKELNVEMLMIFAAIGSAIIGYWTEGAILIFIFAVSGALETYTMNKTQKEISSLMALQPDEAWRLNGNVEERVAVSSLRVGDLLAVKPGERMPADGTIVRGITTIDEAAFTGEAVPVSKKSEDDVLAGTVNLTGAITIKMTKQTNETMFQKIIELVQNAQAERSPSQLFIETFEGKYVKGVLIAVALMMLLPHYLLGWGWQETFYRAMVLLVVSSPCALVASITPATLSAISNGAKKGILFKGGVHLENLYHVKAIAFDKTGTLTKGKPEVTNWFIHSDQSYYETISTIAMIENQSNHPLAQSVVRYATEQGATITNMPEKLEDIAGFGVMAYVDAVKWRIGKPSWFNNVPESIQTDYKALAQEGKTIVMIERNNEIIGYIALKDTLRQETVDAIIQLKKAGIVTIMLTGDSEETAAAIAKEATLDDYAAQCLPKDKVEKIKQFKKQYRTVAMVGDGINDAPALATASIGIAMGEGTDVALETADIILMKNDLPRIAEAIRLSRKMQRVVKQNVVFSLSVIILLVVSNFLQVVDLPLGVIGHEGSTILVILNGLRLLKA
ncbi:heavy metal translocating P-type ATPase [Jeotgalibacillus campisalis]|uniref:ATPase n=1 Tax=Jeotgalibacillus campisalis TaxID=220754 RepID=A0A0C2RSB7_9BACL|nr:heavy metal translocating P-type ATPase [Jeotgalibacillus campisalis]KIL53130.1 ATPase [Jeotgalibacillus campisalis]